MTTPTDAYKAIMSTGAVARTSKVFSIQPDMNVYRLRHTRAEEIVSEAEIRFLDKP